MDLDDITTSDAALVAAFIKFCTRVHASENSSFWFDKGNNEGKYAKYIKSGAPKELTLDDSALVHQFNDLAAKGKYSDMNPLFVKARAHVQGMLAGRMNEFSKSKEYDEYVLVKKAGNIKKALTLLGITGPHAKEMETLLKAYAVGDASEKATIKGKMAKLAKAEQVALALKNAGLL